MAQQDDSKAQPMLIFIPDISGFSQFVHDTEIAHSQHIISELLEVLIDANELDLEVSEIEGDAILFYKSGETTYINELLSQVEKMYIQFHSHLKKYEHTRICHCGACSTAHNLKLKFVVNYGEVGFNHIKDHTKLFGKEVIVAHRLLKNSIDQKEYLLLTDEVIKQYKIQHKERDWSGFQSFHEDYDIGKVKYEYKTLDFLEEKIPEPTIETFTPVDPKNFVMNSRVMMNVPMDLLFNVISDYSIRHLWTVGLRDSDLLNGKITKTGSTHRCLINDDKNDPFFVAHNFQIKKNYVAFSETDKLKGITIVYSLERIGENRTQLIFNTFLKVSGLKRFLFKMFFKKKILADSNKSMLNLLEYCHKIMRKNRQAENQIILSSKSK